MSSWRARKIHGFGGAGSSLPSWSNESWVLPPPESVIGSVVMEAFRASGLDYPRTTVVTDSPEVRISLLATGRFLTIFPASALRFPTRRPEIKVLPVELPMARVPNRNRHPEEPHAQPRRAAFHQTAPAKSQSRWQSENDRYPCRVLARSGARRCPLKCQLLGSKADLLRQSQ